MHVSAQRGRNLVGGLLLPLVLLAGALTATPAGAAAAPAGTRPPTGASVPGDPPLAEYPGLPPRSNQTALTAVATTPTPCGTNGADKVMKRSQVLTRARSWLNVGIPYSQERCYRNQYGDYRTDCSGFVSMAWGLGGPGSAFWTGNLLDRSYTISRSALQAGDALLRYTGNPEENHVALFVKWADAAHTQPWVIEQHGGDEPPYTEERKWSTATASLYMPIRYDHIQEAAPDLGVSAVKFEGLLRFFARGLDGQLIQYYLSDGSWHWQALGGDILGTPGAYVDGDTLRVYVSGTDGTPWQYTFTSGSSWQRTPLPGKITSGTSAVKFEGLLRFFARGLDGQLIQYYLSDGSWHWQALGGDILGTPGAYVDGDTLRVYVSGTDGTPWQYTFTSGSSWQRTPCPARSPDPTPTLATVPSDS